MKVTTEHYFETAALQVDADAAELAEFSEGIPVDPDVADHMGAFEEVALRFKDLDKPLDRELLEKTLKEAR
ncbi:hypothetical protein [Halodesulfovibrio spirochaetisodalis]|uniref:Uncharacterized protein n=1 Tax=Halodesulfovibrio spirochaetisodalis TaxID=1560234 RepID=A0A1B7XAU2_9BACT|nr:hypothetical protein [Halodesulfovibrio spirochaetisodalis]OBQ46475.1 hypothetical protein SP90_12295 [Halodesulfovibrio spirochaetisodalis]